MIARTIAIVCRNLADEASPLLSIGRFELIRTLGRGGNGIVYEAFDPERCERVALKILHERGPSYLYRLKREFRSLAQLRHPSLVALHELFVGADDAYFTMELIAGDDFLSYAYNAALSGEQASARVRDALLQLCEGVHALHRAGTLHRDLKPSNVLVTGAARVVLLDFGLAGDTRPGSLSMAPAPEGTPGYMAPEQARGAACESSDWFSFGCILRRTLQVLAAAKPALQQRSELQSLSALAENLTSDEATARASYPEILAALGRASAPPPAIAIKQEYSCLTARTAELTKLADALERSRTEPVVVVVRGESGSGKSALLTCFARSLEGSSAERPAWVLRGRCYERESLPYKGLDSVIDDLSRVLIALPSGHAARDTLPDAALLIALFPVLGRVPWLHTERPIERADLAELNLLEVRARGFAALRVLLARLAIDRALVLCIDDLQWSDADSGRLLGALLCEEGSPNLLVVLSDRVDRSVTNSALDELQRVAELAPRPVYTEELELGLLGAHEGAALREPLGIDGRLRRLPATSLAILELVSLAGRPLPTRLIADAAQLGIEHHAHIKALRAAGLLRAVLRGDDEWLELEHDGIAAAVLRRIDGHQRVELHLRLIRVLKAQPGATSELLIEQYVGAGEYREAARCAQVAADAAFAALAFARAARLYERALMLGSFDPEARAVLHSQQAVALAYAGRGIESAEAYRAAAMLTADPLRAAPFEQHAADQLMRNGCYREGEASLSRVYRALGFSWPKGRVALVLAIARLVMPSPLRRLVQRLRRVSSEVRRLRVELLAAAGPGFESYDSLRAIHNALLCFDEAEQLVDPRWQVRVKGGRGLLMHMWSSREPRGIAALEHACATAAELGDPSTRGALERQLALAHYMLGRSRAALAAASRSEACIRVAPGTPVELYSVMAIIGSALLDLGRLRDARRQWHVLTHAARLHGDLMTIVWVHTHPVQLAALFATQERARSQAILERASALRAAHPRYFLVSWAHAACSVEHAAYWGEPHEALKVWQREQAVLLDAPFWLLRNKARLVRARACLLAASALPPGRERASLLRRAAWDALLLRRQHSPLDRGIARGLSAGVALLRQRRQRAIAHLDAARALYDECEARLLSAATQYCKGALVGGEQGASLQGPTLAAFVDEGVVDPRRYIAWIACGFREQILGDEP
jgi:serine/threonine protein kinase